MQDPNRSSSIPGFLAGGGELGQRIREYDWGTTALGAVETWPPSLRTALGILLNSAFPMFLFWGDDKLCFYNDAYRPLLGHRGKHPCVGKEGAVVWPEIWHTIGPRLEQVMQTGGSIHHENELVPIYRNGQLEDVYWTYSYSPVFDEAGSVPGVFVTCTDTTGAVLDASSLSQSEKRYRALVTMTSDLVYRMNADWTELRELDGKGFLSSTREPLRNWMPNYVHPGDLALVEEAIQRAICTKALFELEHRVLRADGATGWIFSRAIPILDDMGAIVEWFGAARDITARRQIEDDLRTVRDDLERSKRLYETVTDTTPDLIYVFDLNYRFTYANKALLAMWGMSWEQAIGQGLRALGYEEWHAAMHEREIDQIVATRKPVRGTVTFPHAELGTRYYDYILTPVIGATGAVEAVAGTTRDVTDFKQAEAALRDSEARFRLMADAIPEIIWMADAAGNNEFFNKRWEDYSGIPFAEAAYSETAREFLHPDDAPAVMAAFARSLQTGEPLEVEQRNRAASGEYRWFLNRAAPYRDPKTGAIVKWFGIGTDIHDRKLVEQALQESESRFRTMAEGAPMWIWMTDKAVGVRYANAQMLEYLGLPHPRAFVGQAWEHLTHPDDIGRVYEAFGTAAVRQEPFYFESRVRNAATGAFEWCLFRGVPYLEQGEFTGFIGTGLHIHDRKALEEEMERLVAQRTNELAHSNKELYRSNEDLQQFAHAASHDLKEPVRKIITFASMLESADGAQLSERGRMSLEKVRSAAERMMSMVNGVLVYSKLAATDQVWEPVNLTATLADVEADLEVLIQQKQAVVEVGTLPAVVGAPVLIHQLFYNLLNNALKFSKADEPPRIAIQGRTVGDRVEVTVADNGIGFEPEYAERIFKTFARLHPKDRYEGTGLGLSLCKRIVERHGGTISAAGRLGAGTVFTLTLPAADR